MQQQEKQVIDDVIDVIVMCPCMHNARTILGYSCLHLYPEMHLTQNLGTLHKTVFLSFSYNYMFDIIICVLVRINVRGTPCDVYYTVHGSN